MTPLSLRANFSWVLVSNVLYGVYQWLLVALIAKVSGPETVGQFALALAIVTPVQMFFNMQLRALQASDASHRFPFASYFTLRVLSVLVTIAFIYVLGVVWPLSLDGQRAVLGVLAIKSVESISDVIYGAFQQAERMDISSRCKILESVASLAVFLMVFFLTGDLFIGLIGIMVALLVVLLSVTLPSLRRLGREAAKCRLLALDRQRLQTLVVLAIPLGVTMGLINVSSALPRLALKTFRSDYDVGIYAGFAQLIVAGTIVVGALGQAMTPRLAKYFSQGETAHFFTLVKRLVMVAIAIGMLATVFAYVIGKPVVSLLYTDEYAAYHGTLVLLAASSGFTFAASFQGYALTAARVLRPQVRMLLIVIVVTVCALVLLVPRYGLVGAALSVLLGSATQWIVSAVILQLQVKLDNGQ